MLVNLFLFVFSIGFGSYFLWHGIVGGLINKRIPGGWETPDGWSGTAAAYIGMWKASIGLMGISLAAAFAHNMYHGGGNQIEWMSLTGWLLIYPTMIFYLLSGLVALAYSLRFRSLRWLFIGGMSSVIAITGLILYSGIN